MALLISSVFVFSACEKTIINHGYVIESADFKKITVGKDNANSVYALFGSPTMRSSVISKDGSYNWYYVSKMTEKNGFLDPVVISQKTVIVKFDKNATVMSVTESSYEKSINTVSEKTKTEGKTAGVIGETFGGLGKYMKRYTESDSNKKK